MPLVGNYGATAGPARRLRLKNILDTFLLLFFTIQVWNLLVTETNAYGKETLGESWEDTCEEEMRAFLGILIVTGIKKFPTIESYWFTDC